MPVYGFSDDPNDPDCRPDTRPALRALVDVLGPELRKAGRALRTSHTSIAHGLSPTGSPPTLDTLTIYARRAMAHGVRLSFDVDPTNGLTFSITSTP